MSRQAKSPGFKLYADEWLGSTKITVMSPAEEGAYIRLLCHQWNSADCTLPDNDDELAILSRLGEGWFNGGSTKIRKCFPKHPRRKGRISNPRLLEERRKQEEWRRKSSDGGLKSGKQRASTSKGGSTTLATTLATKGEPNGNMRARDLSFSSLKKDSLSPRAREEKLDHAAEPTAALTDNQAVRMVYDTLRVVPDLHNQQLIEARVTDLAIWGQVLVIWQSNEYRPRSFGRMLTAYDERVAKKQTQMSCSHIGASIPDEELPVEPAPDDIGEPIPPAILDRMILSKNRQFVDTWLAPARYERHDETINLYVPNHLFVEWITEQAISELRECFQCKTVEVRDVSTKRKRRSTGTGSGIPRQATTVSPSNGGG